MSRRKKALLVSALLALAALLWFVLRAGPVSPAAPAPVAASTPREVEAAQEEAPTLFPRVPQRRASGEVVPPLERLPPARTPVIEEISFDKKSVCFNEDLQVTVRARAGGLDDAFLRYRVAGMEGPVVSLRRLTLGSSLERPERGGYTVTVSGRDGTHVTVPLPGIEVKDCRLPNEFELVHAPEPGSEGRVRFTASPVGHNPDLDAFLAKGVDESPTFQPVRYVWSFGDGTTVETTEGTVVHDYGARPQTTLYSYFLVKCEAFDAAGQSLGASKAIELKNPAFETFVKQGVVQLLAQPQPARVDADGRVTVPVRLWHQRTTPVTVTSVKVRRHRGEALGSADEAHPPPTPAVEELFVAPALGTSVISAGGTLAQVAFDQESDRDVAAKEFRLEGQTPEGWPVRGHFLVSRPDLDPVVRRMLVDAEWRAKVLRARLHLKKAEVTEKEVMDLEGEGVYVSLPRAFQGTPPPGFAPPEPQVALEQW
jgi:hypothetical protein